jgi:SAM-dependent methyltransferase
MTQLPAIHLCIMQPKGYVHALGFLDQARYFRHQFRRMGAEVSLAKNRLRHDAVNFVFGAHLGFDASLRERHACVFVNLEQLGQGGAAVSSDYLALLKSSAVVDYDADNRAAYAADPDEVMVVPFLHAPYLRPAEPIALEDRPIDLLFIGSLNERRRELIARIESTGVQVSLFDGALYGPERDAYIVQAKAVFNAHFYETSRFEQARASHCLSLGTPVISERRSQTRPHAAFEDSVLWLAEHELERYFATYFGTPAFYAQARAALQAFEQADPIEAYADLLAFAAGFGMAHAERRPTEAWQPRRVLIGSGADYRPGWLNIDEDEATQADLVGDLSQPITLPFEDHLPQTGPVSLQAGSVELIYAGAALERAADVPRFMRNCLDLLQVGGKLLVQVAHEQAFDTWQNPQHRRAFNEKTWLSFSQQFWQLGWFEHRFHVADFEYLDAQNQPCERPQAHSMRVCLEKVETSPQERTIARTLQPDFSVPDDELPEGGMIGAGMGEGVGALHVPPLAA